MIKFRKYNDIYLLSINNKPLGELYQEIDGFYVYQPSTSSYGFFDQYTLLTIGNKLKELNAEWEKQINEYKSDE